jgi:hypothetical protein
MPCALNLSLADAQGSKLFSGPGFGLVILPTKSPLKKFWDRVILVRSRRSLTVPHVFALALQIPGERPTRELGLWYFSHSALLTSVCPPPTGYLVMSSPRHRSTSLSKDIGTVLAESEKQWLYEEDELLYTPSVQNGLTVDQERELRVKGITFIHNVGQMLNVPQTTVTTAAVYFHRFLMRYSLKAKPGQNPKEVLHHYVGFKLPHCCLLTFHSKSRPSSYSLRPRSKNIQENSRTWSLHAVESHKRIRQWLLMSRPRIIGDGKIQLCSQRTKSLSSCALILLSNRRTFYSLHL